MEKDIKHKSIIPMPWLSEADIKAGTPPRLRMIAHVAAARGYIHINTYLFWVHADNYDEGVREKEWNFMLSSQGECAYKTDHANDPYHFYGVRWEWRDNPTVSDAGKFAATGKLFTKRVEKALKKNPSLNPSNVAQLILAAAIALDVDELALVHRYSSTLTNCEVVPTDHFEAMLHDRVQEEGGSKAITLKRSPYDWPKA